MTTASTTNFDISKISPGRAIQLWYGLPIPAPNTVIALHSDGTPDGLTAPNARHLGFTDKGAILTAKGTWKDVNADEQSGAIKTVFDSGMMGIAADLLQTEDMNIMQLLSAGHGTMTTVSTPQAGKRLGFGIGTQTYTSLAAIWALEADPTKFCIFHIFRAANKNGIGDLNRSRTEKPMVKADFQGYDVAGRLATDAQGYYFIPDAS